VKNALAAGAAAAIAVFALSALFALELRQAMLLSVLTAAMACALGCQRR